MRENSSELVPIEFVANKILLIRGQKVMIDSDLAEFYQIATMRLNEQVKRNHDRFPPDFMFQLTTPEYEYLISQFAISKKGRGGRRTLPYAFTEHGVLMLASVLRGQKAADVSIFIVRAFVRIREILSSNKELAYKIEELEREQKIQNKHINAIYSMFDKFLDEPLKPEAPMGFSRSGK